MFRNKPSALSARHSGRTATGTTARVARAALAAALSIGGVVSTVGGTAGAADVCTLTWTPSTIGIGQTSDLSITSAPTPSLVVFDIVSGSDSAFYGQYLLGQQPTTLNGSAAIDSRFPNVMVGSIVVKVTYPWDQTVIYCSGTLTVASGDTRVEVTPPSPTVSYGDPLDLTPSYDGFEPGDGWDTEPTCSIFDGTSEVSITPVPVGTYTVRCSGGSLPKGYEAYYTESTLTVNKAAATLTYTGTSGATSGSTITLSGSVSPTVCPADGILFTVNGSPVADPSVPYPVSAGEEYDIVVSYDDAHPDCAGSSVSATVTVEAGQVTTTAPATTTPATLPETGSSSLALALSAAAVLIAGLGLRRLGRRTADQAI